MNKITEMAGNVAATFRAQRFQKLKHLPAIPLALHSDAHYLIIKLPDSRLVKLFTGFFILALCIIALQFIRFLPSTTSHISDFSDNTIPAMDINRSVKLQKLLPLLFRDLANEGILVNKGGGHYKSVFVFNGASEEAAIGRSGIYADNNMQVISVSDLDQQSSIPNDEFDFAFTTHFPSASEFIDRTLKVGGFVTVLHSDDNPSGQLQKSSNYKMAYTRRFDLTAMAMRKTGLVKETLSKVQRKLCWHRLLEDTKREALNKLEDVLLEPPRAASGKSRRYMKRTRFLPDLMGDSLESYPRRVFIDVGLPERQGGSGNGWFERHYPKKNKDFEIYKIETVAEEASGKEVGISDWVMGNVKEEEYVVMKAEAEVVEDLMKSRTIPLVDELFMECKPKRRAYWECLALYGRLRDEGIAVHQWWG